MHKDISVVVPTRHRPDSLNKFVDSFYATMRHTPYHKQPYLTVIFDSPNKGCSYYKPRWVSQHITVHEKSSLTELWNRGLILSPTDWVLICNDDIVFKDGWLEYLEKQIASDKYFQINLGHYGAFCMHKSAVLEMGWHDERFRGGGYEDIDWQLRVNEAGYKHMIDNSHSFYETNDNGDIGHFVDHFKSPSDEGWVGNNNEWWICRKWNRPKPIYWNAYPSIRAVNNIDWHPLQTLKYCQMFNREKKFHNIVPNGRQVYP